MIVISETQIEVGAVLLGLSILSFLSSILTIVLIKDMKLWNSYLILIASLASFEIIYDINFFFIPCYQVRICNDITEFTSMFGGTATSLWTNVISTIIFYITLKFDTIDVFKWYYHIFIGVSIPSLILGILNVCITTQLGHQIVFYIYYYTRLITVLYNIILYILITYRLKRIGVNSTNQSVALKALVNRFKYYPMCQLISRIGSAWYEYAYGFGSASYAPNPDTPQLVSMFLDAICTSSSGIGYFMIFLYMQPLAYKNLKARLFCSKYITEDINSLKASIMSNNPMQDSGVFTSSNRSFTDKTSDITSHNGFTKSSIYSENFSMYFSNLSEYDLEKEIKLSMHSNKLDL